MTDTTTLERPKAKTPAKPAAKAPAKGSRAKAKPPMKETEADLETKLQLAKVAKNELVGFRDRIEAIRAEKAELDKKEAEVFKEIKTRGFSVKSFRTVLKERKRERDDVKEELAVTEFYRGLLL